mgnify:CR=1 FL=1
MKALSMKTFTRFVYTSCFMIFCHLPALANGYEQKQIMDNERVRILIVTCPPNAESPNVIRLQDRVVYALEGGTIQRIYANGQESITIPAISSWAVRDRPNENPKFWATKCYSDFYGIQVFGPPYGP